MTIYDKPVTTDEEGFPTATPQPKVVAGAVTGILLTVVVAIIAAITPEMLDGLGAYGVLIYAGVVSLGSSLAAYIKRPADDAS